MTTRVYRSRVRRPPVAWADAPSLEYLVARALITPTEPEAHLATWDRWIEWWDLKGVYGEISDTWQRWNFSAGDHLEAA